MNEIVNKFFLAGNKFMPKVHLKQPGFTYSACESFTKNKERIQKFKETGDTNYIYKNELDKACFQHDIAYGDFKDLARRAGYDKVLRGKPFNTAKNSKHDRYQKGLASMVYKFFNKKSASGSGVANNEIRKILRLAEQLHKPIIRNFKKITVYSEFKVKIWGADLVDMQLLSKLNKGFRFLLYVIDIFSKYAWVVPLKEKEVVSIFNAFQKILYNLARKPNNVWVDKRSGFYNNFFKKWLKDNDIEMYLIQTERKSAVAEKFIRTLKTKIYKYMTSISKNVYIDKLDDIVNEYNNAYHRTIKMKVVDVKNNTYIDSNKKS